MSLFVSPAVTALLASVCVYFGQTPSTALLNWLLAAAATRWVALSVRLFGRLAVRSVDCGPCLQGVGGDGSADGDAMLFWAALRPSALIGSSAGGGAVCSGVRRLLLRAPPVVLPPPVLERAAELLLGLDPGPDLLLAAKAAAGATTAAQSPLSSFPGWLELQLFRPGGYFTWHRQGAS